MTPIEYYESQILNQEIIRDTQQLEVLQIFENVYFALVKQHKQNSSIFKFLKKNNYVKGIYLCGGVGIGKTFLMDCFFNTLPLKKKLRMHFYQFMQYVHAELKLHQGKIDPLNIIAKKISKDAVVLCFDELFVTDITDAMLLGKLFKALFAEGVTLITTSNIVPDELYKNGLQRSQFLPAIELIKKHLQVIVLKSNVDYRKLYLQNAGVFYYPINKENNHKLEKTFEVFSAHEDLNTEPLLINNRTINVIKYTENNAWFKFNDLCKTPRSHHDYLAIAQKFKNIFLSDVHKIFEKEKDKITLFISLIDVLYDNKNKLIMTSEVPIEKIYETGNKKMEFARTLSRLSEMQSKDYFLR